MTIEEFDRNRKTGNMLKVFSGFLSKVILPQKVGGAQQCRSISHYVNSVSCIMAESESSGEIPLKILLKCMNFSAQKHKLQKRKDMDSTPYINHPIGVAHILTDAGVTDAEVIMAALLHDTVEDTSTTFEEIEQHFGPRVRRIVAEVTDDKSLPKQERKLRQIEKARKCSDEAKLVKLADKLDNLRDLLRGNPMGWSDERVKEYFIWARKVIDGLRGTNSKIEHQIDEVLRLNPYG